MGSYPMIVRKEENGIADYSYNQKPNGPGLAEVVYSPGIPDEDDDASNEQRENVGVNDKIAEVIGVAVIASW